MNNKTNYIEKLFSDPKYINELVKIHKDLTSVRRFKRKMDDIEKEITWFVGNEKTRFIPDYYGFYDHAQKHYIPKQEEKNILPRYKELLGNYNTSEMPTYFFCLVLLGYFHNEEISFMKKHEKDYENLSEALAKEFQILHNKRKLLTGFFEKFDVLVAIFINAVDMEEVEYLDDDIKDLDSRAIKHRFMAAIRKQDKSMAFKLLGRMRELDEGEDYYFEALSHYINEEYTDTIRYTSKLEKGNIDYPSAVALKLECYSFLGDLSGFLKCIEENQEMTFDLWHIIYLLMTLMLNVDLDKDELDEANQDVFDKIKYNGEALPYYVGMARRLATNIIIEGFEIIDEANALSDAVSNFHMSGKTRDRLDILRMALTAYPEDLYLYLDLTYLADKDFKVVKEDVMGRLLKLLIDENPDHAFENLRVAFVMQLRFGEVDAFIQNVVSNYDALAAYAEKGEKGADELFRLAYIEGALKGNIDEKIKNRIEQKEEIDLGQNISDKKIIKILSSQGKIAYQSAEWQFRKSQEEDYGWKDAGMISLGYYRILEVELNQKFIIPLLSSIGYTVLDHEFTAHLNTLSGEPKKDYRNKWGTILRTYKDMEENNFTGNGFMLGVLNHFFRAIGSQYDVTDTLATFIRSQLRNVLNSYGLQKFDEGFFEDMTGDDTRNKFRNPPAHTKYLSYDVACECREVFRESVLELGEMLV